MRASWPGKPDSPPAAPCEPLSARPGRRRRHGTHGTGRAARAPSLTWVPSSSAAGWSSCAGTARSTGPRAPVGLVGLRAGLPGVRRVRAGGTGPGPRPWAGRRRAAPGVGGRCPRGRRSDRRPTPSWSTRCGPPCVAKPASPAACWGACCATSSSDAGARTRAWLGTAGSAPVSVTCWGCWRAAATSRTSPPRWCCRRRPSDRTCSTCWTSSRCTRVRQAVDFVLEHDLLDRPPTEGQP